jgi:hypothetical protein
MVAGQGLVPLLPTKDPVTVLATDHPANVKNPVVPYRRPGNGSRHTGSRQLKISPQYPWLARIGGHTTMDCPPQKDRRHCFPPLTEEAKYVSVHGNTTGRNDFDESEINDVLWEIARHEWDGVKQLNKSSFFLKGCENCSSKSATFARCTRPPTSSTWHRGGLGLN